MPNLLFAHCFCGCLLLCVCTSFGQARQSRIELAHSDEQVEQLVQATDDDYKTFNVSAALKFADKRVEKQYRRAGVKAWEKADLDGNGLLDLLVTGTHYRGKCQVVCLLDMGNGRLVLEPFARQFYRACPVAAIVYDGAQPLIRYTDFEKPFLDEKLAGKQAFRLIYKYGGFVEYNRFATDKALPDSIRYEFDFAYHEVVEQRITVDATGNATYRSCTYPVLQESKKTYEVLRTTLSSQQLAEIYGLIGYMAVQHLQPAYRTGFNHVPRITLVVAYPDGRKIEISDQGAMGTFGLMRLYALLGQLRRSQLWQPAKP